MAREDPNSTIAKAHNVFIRLALPPYTIHFKSSSYLHPTTLDLLDKKVSKETLKATSSTSDVSLSNAVRESIGTDATFWAEWIEVVRAAVPSLERRSFDVLDDQGVDYESARGVLIAGNYPGLWRDLERLNDIVSIGRNLLTVGKAVQDLASEYGVESEMFRLVHVCVRVTARGYDSEAGTQEEEKWQWVVNAYKKVLITGLQLLNNLVAQNEEQKMRLWVSLFDTPPQIENPEPEQKQVTRKPPPPPPEPELVTQPEPPFSTHDVLLAYGATGPSQRLSPLEMQAAQPLYAEEGFKPIPKEAQRELDRKTYKPNAWVYFVAKHKSACIQQFQQLHKRSPMLGEIHKNLPHFWHQLDTPDLQKSAKTGTNGLWQLYTRMFQNEMEHYRKELDAWNDAQNKPRPPTPPREPQKPLPPPPKPAPPPVSFEDLEDDLTARLKETGPVTAPAGYDFGEYKDLDFNPLDPKDEDEERDLKMLFTAEAGKKILEQGKGELMRRLEGDSSSNGRRHSISGSALSPNEAADGSMAEMFSELQKGRDEDARKSRRRRTSEPALLHGPLNDQQNGEDSLEEDGLDVSDESASDSGSEESYPGSSEDGRGLLTDVPLILGPSEIEVLPMLIMSGITQPPPKPHQDHLIEWEIYMPPPDVPWEESYDGQRKMRQFHTLRTNLLLSQTSGRNLLRELLIFVAAWDLREEELYFKFMLKITEAILVNGLMPYAYHAFRDRSKSKDIISPAQAVLIKLLTSIFRSRTTANLRTIRESYEADSERKVANPMFGPMPHPLYLARMKLCVTRADLQLMTFLFSEFRQHIIPQTCALIFLQGQVRRGRAGSEDFPLNLWDMERMYEGVYQVLEFFAAIVEEIPANTAPTPAKQHLLGGPAHPLSGYWGAEQPRGIKEENERLREERYPTSEAKVLERERRTGEWFSWKKVLGEWEMVSELVTLLRELEDGIPKINMQGVPQPMAPQKPIAPPAEHLTRSISVDAVNTTADATTATPGAPQTPVSVERPFDLSPDLHGANNTQPLSPLSVDGEPEHPLAYPPSDPAAPLSSHDQDEPADFEWRNLKKLTVLVLSSLIYKNPEQKTVQRQLRDYGGLEVLLRCCGPSVPPKDPSATTTGATAGMSNNGSGSGGDENNPYIREHAIMCLRFAIENNEENWHALCGMGGMNFDPNTGKKIPEDMKKKLNLEDINKTVFEVGGRPSAPAKQASNDDSAKKTATPTAGAADGKGKAPASAAKATAPPGFKPNRDKSGHERLAESLALADKLTDTSLTAEKAAELMQQALRNLPDGVEKLRLGGEKLLPLADPKLLAAVRGERAASDAAKADVLARLDKAFEGAEKALGPGR